MGALVTALSLDAPPKAPVRVVEDEYFGVKISDPYRWLESIKSSPEAQEWLKAQADYSRKLIDSMPGREKLKARISELVNSEPAAIAKPRQLANGNLFYLKTAADQNTAKLCFRRSSSEDEIVLVDPDDFQKRTGRPYAINYFEPSWDGKFVAFGISAQGSESAEIRVIDTASKRETGEVIPRCDEGLVSWLPDGKHFLFNQLQELKPNQPATEKYFNSKTMLHELGSDPAKDEIYLAAGSNSSIAINGYQIPVILTASGSDYAFAIVANSVQPEFEIFVASLADLKPETKWRKLVSFEDQVVSLGISQDRAYFLTHKNAPRFKIVSRSLNIVESEEEKEVIPASEKVIQQLLSAKDGVYYTASDGVDCRLYRLNPSDPARQETIPLPITGWVSIQDSFLGDLRKPGVLVAFSSWVQATSYYSYDPEKNRLEELALRSPGPYDKPKDVVSQEVKIKSHDGALVPMSIIGMKDFQRDGTHAALLSGYGALGFVSEPNYQPANLAFLEHGIWLAVAQVRGGGVYGDDWFRAGQKSNKPNTWKDFIACGEYLINEKYAAKNKLAGTGRSAGGITIGRAVTDRPDLFAVAFPVVGCLDMLRFESTALGAVNIPEFGTVKDEAGFRALREMSTYDHIKEGTAYPAILLYHGYNDPRVDVWISAKAGARFQAATTSGKPVLLDIDYESGHGIGNTKAQDIQQTTDLLSVMLWQLGDPEFQPAKED
jgi:prolyl oligopeptidase